MSLRRIEIDRIVLPDMGLGPSDEHAIRREIAKALGKAFKRPEFPEHLDIDRSIGHAVSRIESRGGRPDQAGFAESIAETVVKTILEQGGSHG